MHIRSAKVCCPECRYLNDEELFPNENIVSFLLQMVTLWVSPTFVKGISLDALNDLMCEIQL